MRAGESISVYGVFGETYLDPNRVFIGEGRHGLHMTWYDLT